MRQKKKVRSVKAKKSVIKNKAKKTTTALSLTDKMEKDFRETPAKIVALYQKDIAVSKQQETKLKNELQKAEVLKKALQSKIAALSSKKLTSASKKQLNSTKKMQVQLTKAISDFSVKLEAIKKLVRTLTEKQALFSALGKQLAKLEKELMMKARQAEKAKAAKAKKVKAKKTSAKKSKAAPVMQQEEANEFDSSPVEDEIMENDSAETTETETSDQTL